MKHDDGMDGHNFACKVCGAWVSEYGCVRVLFPEPNKDFPAVSSSFLPANTGTAKYANEAAAVIDEVHGDGQLPKLSLDGVAEDGALGYIDVNPARKNPQINVRSGGPWPRLTAAHELGHALDRYAFSDGLSWASEVSAEFADWRVAVKATESWRELNAYAWMNDYYLTDHELWARSYAQWIAKRSGDPTMLDGVTQIRRDVLPERHWSDEDFEPVAAAIDAIFEKRGWLRPKPTNP